MNEQTTGPQPKPRGVSSQAGLASVQEATPARAGVPARLIDPAAIDVEALAAVLRRPKRGPRWFCKDCGIALPTLADADRHIDETFEQAKAEGRTVSHTAKRTPKPTWTLRDQAEAVVAHLTGRS